MAAAEKMLTDESRAPVRTIGDRVTETRGRTTGFDVLRIALAITVLSWHSLYSTYGWDNWIWHSHKTRSFPSLILPMFFALSGFLVAGSLVRTKSLSSFMTLRMMRLLPALFVEVCLSALILGPLVTTLPLGEYFRGQAFWNYWFNIVGYIHYQLPGVFESNPAHGIVNISLWTVPFELECYLALMAISICGLVPRLRALFWVLIAAWIGITAYELLTADLDMAQWARPAGRLLVVCFLGGLGLFIYRDYVPLNRRWFVVSLGLTIIFLARADTAFLAALPAAYVTVYIGLMNLPRIPVLMGGDYSYGIYLYAFPIQQTYVWLDPLSWSAWTAPYDHVWWTNILMALPCTLAFAMFSWHVIEKPVLSRKAVVLALVERIRLALVSWVPVPAVREPMRSNPARTD